MFSNLLNIPYFATNIFLIFVVGIFAVIFLILIQSCTLLVINIDFTNIIKNIWYKLFKKNNDKEALNSSDELNTEDIKNEYDYNYGIEHNIIDNIEDDSIAVIDIDKPIKLDYVTCLIISLFSFSIITSVILISLGIGNLIAGKFIL